jgi:hypothetical protein
MKETTTNNNKKHISTEMLSKPTHTLCEYEKIRQTNINEKTAGWAALNADKSSSEATHFKEWVVKYTNSIQSNQHIAMFELNDFMKFLYDNKAPYTQVIELTLYLY